MPQLEDRVDALLHSVIDLREIEQGQRAPMWDAAVRRTFPGLSVKLMESATMRGLINCIKMGAGELFMIDSAPANVIFHPPKGTGGIHPHLSLMVQASGATCVSQQGRSSLLSVGDLCMIDEAKSFRLVGEHRSRILFLRMPRMAALSRYPQIERRLATVLPADEPGVRILGDTLQALWSEAGLLGELQLSAMMNAVIQMLGVVGPFSALPATADWRVRRALDYIELNLSVAGLTAEAVAQDQHISCRRLDQLMHDAFDHSIASHLWSRRLEKAAEDLRDPHRSKLSIAQIAFANGFEDAAHFTRAFKRRFSVTPGQWRLN
mgnify:CR=1 FL=1